MIKNLTKKKKAFTLVEVIIVLAIIAIIAAIAIPNLTKVRTTSKIKADTQSCETIRRTVLSLVTDDTIQVPSTGDTVFDFNFGVKVSGSETKNTGKVTGISDETQATIQIGPSVEGIGGNDADKDRASKVEYIADFFKDIQAPQEDGKTNYQVTIYKVGHEKAGEVEVKTIPAN